MERNNNFKDHRNGTGGGRGNTDREDMVPEQNPGVQVEVPEKNGTLAGLSSNTNILDLGTNDGEAATAYLEPESNQLFKNFSKEVFLYHYGRKMTGVNEELAMSAPNPFQVELVLDTLFKYCTFPTLKECRLVSTHLYNSSLPAWKRSAKIRLTAQQQDVFLGLIENAFGDSFYGFPFVTSYLFYKTLPTKRFVDVIGSTVVALELNNVKFTSLGQFRYLIYESFPNMKALIISKTCKCLPDAFEQVIPDILRPLRCRPPDLKSFDLEYSTLELVPWTEFLNNFPGLENICLHDRRGFELIPFLTALAAVRQQDSSKLQLKHFKSQNIKAGNDILISVLLGKGLRLENLWIQLRRLDDPARALRELLSIHRASFKCPRLDIFDVLLIPEEVFPQPIKDGLLYNLTELILEYNGGFTSMTFLKWVPNLQKLEIGGTLWLMRDTDLVKMDGVRLTNCKELNLYTSEEGLCSEHFRTLARWIPNVQRLSVCFVNNEKFAMIAEVWPNLKSLVITSALVDDCGLSGLDCKDVRRINRGGEGSSWTPVSVRRPNLSSLKFLRYFKMFRFPYGSKLGYCAGISIREVIKTGNLQECFIQTGFQLVPEQFWDELKRQYAING